MQSATLGWLKQYFLLIVSVVLMIVWLTFPPSAIAEASAIRTLTVTGEGKEMISATLTQIQLGVEVQGKTASEVQQELAQKSQSVVNFLRDRQVQQLKTTGISLQPNYNYNSDQRELIGYIGNNSVSFSLETEKIGNILDEAVKAGATRIDQISFTATDSAIDAARSKALKSAIGNAQSQAEAVLTTLNFSTKDTVKIQINGANLSQPSPIQNLEAGSLAKDAQAYTPVVGGEQTIYGSVTLEIQY